MVSQGNMDLSDPINFRARYLISGCTPKVGGTREMIVRLRRAGGSAATVPRSADRSSVDSRRRHHQPFSAPPRRVVTDNERDPRWCTSPR